MQHLQLTNRPPSFLSKSYMEIFLCILLFLILTTGSFCTDPVGDTLAFNRSLRAIDNETLVSANGKFELGFFSPCNCSDHYLGIWFRNIPVQTVIWVANRDNPVTNSSGAVTITEAGNIIIYDSQPGNVVWSSKSSAVLENPLLQLLDSGNLVVKDSKNYVWESFNYPSDTLIEGMKQGWNRKTGQNWYLTSWKSLEDPSTGEFTFVMDPIGLPEIFLRSGSEITYRKGPYDGVQLGGGPKLKSYPVFRPQFVHNETYDYYAFENSNDTIVSMFVLRHHGMLEHVTWCPNSNEWCVTFSLPRDHCDAYAKCGPNGVCSMDKAPICHCPAGFVPKLPDEWDETEGHSGCILRTPRNCSGRNEGFKKFSKLKMPANSYIVDQGKEMSQVECQKACLRNCSCSAYAITKISSCVMWFGDLMDIREYSTEGQTMYICMASSDIGLGYDNRRIIVLVSTMSGFMVLVSVGCYIAWKKKFVTQTGKITDTQRQNDGLNLGEKDLELQLFDLSTIAVATCKFSCANKIGQGGFGPVYKGKLLNGQEIAVKTLSKSSGQGGKEFKNEVRLMSKLQHRNLVRLLDCCIHADDRILVYEYMPNKSLDYHIFDETKGASLGWQNRFDIIVGVARGLLYLHRDSRLKIIHRDLKASNVLLDGDMNPKISDFGLARMFACDQGEEKTCRVMGTYGYMSPEYAIDGQFSVKSDVFSFGVLVLEIISGQRNREFYHPDHDLNLLGHAWKLWNEGRAAELLTNSLNENQTNSSEVLKCIHIGLLCVQQRPEDRPKMSSVVSMLDSDSSTLPQPSEPAYYYTDRCLISHRNPLQSSNQVTVTNLLGRLPYIFSMYMLFHFWIIFFSILGLFFFGQ